MTACEFLMMFLEPELLMLRFYCRTELWESGFSSAHYNLISNCLQLALLNS